MHPSVITWISAVVSESICTLIPSNMHQNDEVMRLKEVGKVVKHMWQSGPFFLALKSVDSVWSKARLHTKTPSTKHRPKTRGKASVLLRLASVVNES